MPLAEIGNVFWIEGNNTVVHLIAKVWSGYTPADTECEEYSADCGASGQSWWSSDMGVRQTLTAKNPPDGLPLCVVCFPNKVQPLAKAIPPPAAEDRLNIAEPGVSGCQTFFEPDTNIG